MHLRFYNIWDCVIYEIFVTEFRFHFPPRVAWVLGRGENCSRLQSSRENKNDFIPWLLKVEREGAFILILCLICGSEQYTISTMTKHFFLRWSDGSVCLRTQRAMRSSRGNCSRIKFPMIQDVVLTNWYKSTFHIRFFLIQKKRRHSTRHVFKIGSHVLQYFHVFLDHQSWRLAWVVWIFLQLGCFECLLETKLVGCECFSNFN